MTRTRDDNTIPPYVRAPLVKRIYTSALVLTAIGVAGTVPFGLSFSLSLFMGSAIAVSGFWLLERTLRWMVQAATARKRAGAVGLSLLKYLIIGAAFYGVVRADAINMAAFSAGLTVVFFAALASLGWQRMGKAR